MSEKSPEETPEETPLDEPTVDDADETSAPAGDPEPADDVASDDEVIEELEKDLPKDETPRAGAPIRRKTAKAPVKKATATRKRKDAEVEHEDRYKAKNPGEFVQQSVGELKKVVWPTWPVLLQYFAAVLMFVLFIILIVSALDAGFGWGLLKLLGGK